MTPEIIEPRAGDPDRAEDLLDAIAEVLKKPKGALIVKDGVLYLCVANQANGHWRAIAEVAVLSCFELKWRPITWTPTR